MWLRPGSNVQKWAEAQSCVALRSENPVEQRNSDFGEKDIIQIRVRNRGKTFRFKGKNK